MEHETNANVDDTLERCARTQSSHCDPGVDPPQFSGGSLDVRLLWDALLWMSSGLISCRESALLQG
jgi:hypothetical protein